MPAFEWDERKNRTNQAKHGIPFEVVPACFEGPMLVGLDTRFDYGEPRWRAMALLQDVPVVIAFTECGSNIRIISARKADRNERKKFQAYLSKSSR